MAQNKPYEHSIYKKKIPKKSSGWEKSMMKKKTCKQPFNAKPKQCTRMKMLSLNKNGIRTPRHFTKENSTHFEEKWKRKCLR